MLSKSILLQQLWGPIHFLLILLASGLNLSAPVNISKPHLIFMVADDLGWNDIGFRNPDIHSPNLDSLARSGIILNHAYVNHICTPSRSAFMTGYFPIRTGMQTHVIPMLGVHGLPTQFKILPETMQELGYKTHIVGKWHLGSCNSSYLPNSRGFQTYLGLMSGGEFYYSHSLSMNFTNNATGAPNETQVYDFWNQTTPALEYKGRYSSIPFVLQVKHILDTWDRHSPLFLYIPFQLTHAPQEVDFSHELWYSNIKNKYRRTFSGMVSALDNDVGLIINLLKQYGIYDNSVIVFTADNGGEVANGGNNYPLRGCKYTMWEGGTRATAFIHSPKLNSTGYTYDGIVHAVDWYATFVSLAGGVPDPKLDSINVWNAITTNTKSPRTQFVYNLDLSTGNLTGAIRVGDWKLIVGKAGLPAEQIPPENVTGYYANKVGEMTTADDVPGAPLFRLFNVTGDPTENYNVAQQNLDVVLQLLRTLTEYRNQMVYPTYQPQDNNLYRKRTTDLSILNTNWCQPITQVTLMPPVTFSDILNLFLK